MESRGAILSLLGRGVEIVWNLGLYWSALTYDCLVGRDEEVVPHRARQLRDLLCNLGPSFIKAGQVIIFFIYALFVCKRRSISINNEVMLKGPNHAPLPPPHPTPPKKKEKKAPWHTAQGE